MQAEQITADVQTIENLQKVFDYIGGYGGQIISNNQKEYWNFGLEVMEEDDGYKNINTGVYLLGQGRDKLFKFSVPCIMFNAELELDNYKIIKAYINNCNLSCEEGTTVIFDDGTLVENIIVGSKIKQVRKKIEDLITYYNIDYDRDYGFDPNIPFEDNIYDLSLKYDYDIPYDLNLSNMFAAMMNNIVNRGPYLTNPYHIIRYDCPVFGF